MIRIWICFCKTASFNFLNSSQIFDIFKWIALNSVLYQIKGEIRKLDKPQSTRPLRVWLHDKEGFDIKDIE